MQERHLINLKYLAASKNKLIKGEISLQNMENNFFLLTKCILMLEGKLYAHCFVRLITPVFTTSFQNGQPITLAKIKGICWAYYL